MEVITSRNNQLIKHIRKLTSDREYRRSSGLFFGEGPKLLAEALKAGTVIEGVVTARGVDLPGLDGLWRAEAPADLLDSLCDTRTPQGVLFLAKMPGLSPPERLEGGRWLVLDGLQDPGNVGTIWRTADAFGAAGLFDYLRNRQYASVELAGVVSYLCVLSNVVIVKTALPETPVIIDARCVAGPDNTLHEKALDVMQGLQVQVKNR